MKDRAKFKTVILPFMKTYGLEPTGPMLQLWWNVLEPYDDEDVHQAVIRLMRGSFDGYGKPTPGDIIREIEGSPDDKAQIGWALLWTAITRCGAWESVAFPGCLTLHSVIEAMGGWTKLCSMDERELLNSRGMFTRIFRRMAADGEVSKTHLVGLYEANQIKCGEIPSPPKEIVFENGQIEIIGREKLLLPGGNDNEDGTESGRQESG